MAERWRGHGKCIRKINTTTINEEELVESRKGYVLKIYHITKADGSRGFWPSVRLGASCVENCDIVLGTDDAAFEAAKKEGIGLLIKRSEEH